METNIRFLLQKGRSPLEEAQICGKYELVKIFEQQQMEVRISSVNPLNYKDNLYDT